jgi:hypothetical protein
MSILDFSFTDHQTRWKLKEIHFQPSINLLVGLSGAGKSMTLQWLATTCLAAIDPDYVPRNCEWSITLSIDGDRYRWAARTTVEGDVNAEEAGGVVADLGDSAFTSESITVNDERLLDRTATSLTLHGEHLPDLPRDASAIGLLRRDPRLAPLARALRHVRLSYQDLLRRDIRVDGLTFARGRHSDHHSLAALAAIPLLLPLKAYVLQEHLPADFKRLILDPYRDIFPSVEAIRVDLASNLFPNIPVQRRRNGDLIDVAIREHDVPTWIGSEDLSSGMHQTLVHLLELALSPPAPSSSSTSTRTAWASTACRPSPSTSSSAPAISSSSSPATTPTSSTTSTRGTGWSSVAAAASSRSYPRPRSPASTHTRARTPSFSS